MTDQKHSSTRRQFISAMAALGASALPWPALGAQQATAQFITKKMPGSGEALPVIGMGTSRTFDVGADQALRDARLDVFKTFVEMGGTIIDSSPMYGTAEDVIGYCLKQLDPKPKLYSATKVWIEGKEAGVKQMENSARLWGLPGFDLMQVHNLVNWQPHLETLQKWKAAGKIRHIGITTSHGRLHKEFEAIMAQEPLDFVQLSYNIIDREAEAKLLPLALERGQAVMANRPFQRGALFSAVKGKELPGWASEIDCANWAQFFLKFVVSHPAVTCAIPATRRSDHMRENMGANTGRLPDEAMRKKMISVLEDL